MSEVVGLPVFAHFTVTEQATQLREFLHSLDSKVPTDSKSPLEADVIDLINHSKLLGNLDSEQDVEMSLNALMILVTACAPAQRLEVVTAFCDTLVDAKEFSPQSARNYGGELLRVMSNLFHALSDKSEVNFGALQYKIYCSMLEIAGNSGNVSRIPTDLNTLNLWFELWKCTVDQKRECLRKLHSVLLREDQTVEEASRAMVELLGTYTQADAVAARGDASECIRAAIAAPSTCIFDHLMSLRPVQALSKEPIYKLLEVFVSGILKDYEEFYKANKSFVDSLPLKHEKNVHKMRVLTLVTIGERRTEIPMAELASLLNVEKGEKLEEFIIEAVQTGMIQAKIDASSERVLISSVRHRTFGIEQWSQLRARLAHWHQNLSQLQGNMSQMLVSVAE